MMRRASTPHTALHQVHVAVLEWYGANGRGLAFRHSTDPWEILVSEVMAQQTQAPRAAEAWTRFMAEFPTVASLAAASPAAVIRAWRGLGYNRRALALRGAAIAIVEEHHGRVPDTLEGLMRLPGVGPYTARAVLAIGYGRPVAALDVNIRRVIGRAWFGGVPPAASELQATADALVPEGAAAAWTHALMDIGAAFCRPREPRCADCPLRDACADRARGTADASEVVVGASEVGADPVRSAPRAVRPGARGIPFERTTRWLRGRILDRLRDAPDGTWLAFDDGIGAHEATAVRAAVAKLAAEGLIETAGSRARLALS